MDDSEDEGRYIVKPSLRSKPSIRNPQAYPMNTHYSNYDELEQEDGEFDEDEEDDDHQQEEEEIPKPNNAPKEYYYNPYYEGDLKSNKKKRKMEPLMANFEFSPRSGIGLHIGESSKDSWNEEESFVLLEVWGERYLELGRRSLRVDDWVDVAEKVSEMSGRVKSEMECRNQLDVLKKKFKKERAKMEKVGGGFVSKWVFFKKMDVLLNLRMRGHCGLGCGVDSGEYVFMNPRIYLDKSNVLDEMRDSPGPSDEENVEEEDNLGAEGEVEEDSGESSRLLAESIQRFAEIYEKIESSKRKQMVELEKMRRDFQMDLELQKKQIVDRAQTEIAKIREMDGEGDDDEDEEENDNEEEEEEEEEDDNDDDNDVPAEDLQV